MKRKVLYSLLIGLSFGLLGVGTVSADTPTREWCFGFDKDTGTITNYKNYSYKCSTDVVIPSTIEGITVERIGARAFMGDYISSVVIPSTVKTIGNLAFAKNMLTKIDIPKTVTKIGYAAFNNNPAENITFIYDRQDSTKLISVAMDADSYTYEYEYIDVKVPSGVKTIGKNAFYGMYIDNLDISHGVETLEDQALYGSYIYNIVVSSKIKNPNYDVDIEQIPGADTIYHSWYYYDEDWNYLGDKYDSSMKIGFLVANRYIQPEIYIISGKALAYNKLKLSWESYGSYDGVEIWKHNPKTDKYEYFTKTSRNSDITITKGVVPGKANWFKVRSYVTTPDKKKHYSDFSDKIKITTKLSTPTSVKAKKYKKGIAKITWKKVAGADGYSVYRYNKRTNKYTLIANTKNLSYINKKLTKGKGYYYKVRAYKVVDGKKVYSGYSKNSYVRV